MDLRRECFVRFFIETEVQSDEGASWKWFESSVAKTYKRALIVDLLLVCVMVRRLQLRPVLQCTSAGRQTHKHKNTTPTHIHCSHMIVTISFLF